MPRPKMEGYVPTQMRLPKELHAYMKKEAERMDIPQNSVLVMLLDHGRTLWEASKKHPEAFLKNNT